MLRALAFATLLTLPAPAMAQDVPTFTQDDSMVMVECIEAVRDIDAGGAETGARQADCIGAAANACMDEPDGSTTIGMITCLDRERDWWDGQLNAHYSSLMETLDQDRADALREAQRAWLDYREKACAFELQYWGEGTIRGVAYASCMRDATARRAETLAAYLDGTS